MGRVNLGRWLKGSDGTIVNGSLMDQLACMALAAASRRDALFERAFEADLFHQAGEHYNRAEALRDSARDALHAERRN